jgi:hypothetical protein
MVSPKALSPAKGQALLAYICPTSLRNAEAALHWYERSSAAGCPEGCLGLALLLARRRSNAPDRPRIVALLRRAAAAGLPNEIFLLGVFTEHGYGMQRDIDKAVRLYRAAAEKGLASAQLRLGLGLVRGEWASRDEITGEAWMRRAALAGNVEAASRLGDHHAKIQPPTLSRRLSSVGRRSRAVIGQPPRV